MRPNRYPSAVLAAVLVHARCSTGTLGSSATWSLNPVRNYTAADRFSFVHVPKCAGKHSFHGHGFARQTLRHQCHPTPKHTHTRAPPPHTHTRTLGDVPLPWQERSGHAAAPPRSRAHARQLVSVVCVAVAGRGRSASAHTGAQAHGYRPPGTRAHACPWAGKGASGWTACMRAK